MEVLPLIGCAMIAAVLCLLLKQYKPEFAVVLSIVAGVLLFLAVFAGLRPVFTTITDLMNRTDIGNVYTKTLVKALGICYLVELASDSCRDAGQTAIAGKVELVGRVAVLLLALPMFQNLADMALGLLKN